MFNSVRSFSITASVARIAYRKPVGPYQKFVRDNFAAFQDANSSASPAEISKLIGKEWKSSESVQAKYNAEFQSALESFKAKDPAFAYVVKPVHPWNKYIKDHQKAVGKELKTKDKSAITAELRKRFEALPAEETEAKIAKYKKAVRKYKAEVQKSNGISRPANPYIRFAVEFRSKSDSPEVQKSISALASSASEAWKNLSAQEKAVYEQAFAEENAKYKAAKSDSKRAQPPNKYALFVKEQYPAVSAENPDAKPTEIVKLISQEWQKVKDSY